MAINKTTRNSTNPKTIPIAFDNVSDLNSYTFLEVGDRVRTLGYYAPGDGGGNDYEIVAAGTGTDDGGSFIDLSGSGLQAKGLFKPPLSVMQFGAKADLDEDSSFAFQSACDVPGSKNIYIPNGHYRFSNTVYLTSDTTLEGETQEGVKITPPDSDDASTFDSSRIFFALRDYEGSGTLWDDPSFSQYWGPHSNIHIKNMTVTSPIGTTDFSSCIQLQMINNSSVEKVRVTRAIDAAIRYDGYGSGLFVDDPYSSFFGNTENVRVVDCRVEDSWIGIEFEGLVKNGKVYDCIIQSAVRGLRNTSSENCTWQNNEVQAVKVSGDHYGRTPTSPVAMMVGRARGGDFSGNRLSTGDEDTPAITLQGVSFIKIINNEVFSGYYTESGGGDTGGDNAFDGLNELRIEGNKFYSTGTSTDGQTNVVARLRIADSDSVFRNNFSLNKFHVTNIYRGILEDNKGVVVNERQDETIERNTYNPTTGGVTAGTFLERESTRDGEVFIVREYHEGRLTIQGLVNVSLSSEAAVEKTITMPFSNKTFERNPEATLTVINNSGSDFGRYIASVNPSTASISMLVRHIDGTARTDTVSVQVTLDGRWK